MTDISVDPLRLVNREPWTEDAACRGLWDLFDEQGTTRHSTYEPAMGRRPHQRSRPTDRTQRMNSRPLSPEDSKLLSEVIHLITDAMSVRQLQDDIDLPRPPLRWSGNSPFDPDPDPETLCTVCGNDTPTVRCCGQAFDYDRNM